MQNAAADHGPALARKLFDVIDAFDLASTGELLEESFRLHYHGIPEPISRDALLDLLRGYSDSFPDMRHEIREILPSGEFVTVRLVLHASHQGSWEGIEATGRKVEVPAIHILRLDGGKVAEWWAAEDDLGLLRQLGAVVAIPAASS
jgi:predicted ester cyclase